jgi:PAS domain S-box-containing protein
MTEPPRDQNSLSAVFLRSLSRKFSLGVILIGIVVILSWIFDIPLLKTVLPQLPTMKVNAAVCSVLAGVALRGWHQHFKVQNLKSQRKTQCLIFSCAFLIILISSLTLFEYGFNVDLGIDQLLFQQPEPVGSLAVLGRMAPNTAFAFLLVGSALLLRSDRRPGICLAQAMAIITWLISFVGLLGHVYGSVYFYTAGSYTGMAIHAAISLQLLSIGILCALPHSGFMPLITSGGAGSMMMRRLLPVAIALPLLVGGLSVLGHHLHLYSDRVEDVLFSTLNILVFSGLVGWNAEVLNRVDDRRRRAEQALQQVNAELEQRIEERTLALTRSQQQLRAIVEAEPECVKIITADGILKSINPSGLAIVEADSVEQALEQCIFPLIDPDYRQIFVEFTQQVANGKAGTLEFEGTGLKGTHSWLESHAVPLLMPDEATPLVLAVTRDITERKQAEIALRQSEECLRSILQNMPVMLDAFDETWNIIMWNQECERVTGFLADDVIKNPTIMEQFYPDAAYREQMMAVWVERGNNYRNWEWDITCKDGSTRTISWSNISDSFQ